MLNKLRIFLYNLPCFSGSLYTAVSMVNCAQGEKRQTFINIIALSHLRFNSCQKCEVQSYKYNISISDTKTEVRTDLLHGIELVYMLTCYLCLSVPELSGPHHSVTNQPQLYFIYQCVYIYV